MAVENKLIGDRSATEATGEAGIGYRLLYFLGFTPWDYGHVPPELVELIEGPQALPPGRALDLGCGTGTQAIYLAQHGWQVTAVDYVGRALERARARAAAAGVAPRWIQGDVTRLPTLDIGDGYSLVFDFGCYHGLSAEQRLGYAAGVNAVTASGTTLLVFSFTSGFRGPAPRGVSRDELLGDFGAGWELRSSSPARGLRLPPFLRRANPTWYRLHRT